MKKTLTVLQDDIDNGVEGHTSKCAVARAVAREWDAERVSVVDDVCCAIGGVRYCASLGPGEKDFIYRFDKGLKVEPFKAEVELREDP